MFVFLWVDCVCWHAVDLPYCQLKTREGSFKVFILIQSLCFCSYTQKNSRRKHFQLWCVLHKHILSFLYLKGSVKAATMRSNSPNYSRVQTELRRLFKCTREPPLCIQGDGFILSVAVVKALSADFFCWGWIGSGPWWEDLRGLEMLRGFSETMHRCEDAH